MWKCKEWWNVQLTLGIWHGPLSQHPLPPARDQPLLKGVTKTIKNEPKEQKGGFLSMLWVTLGASLLENLLAGKGIVRAGSGKKKGKGMTRAGTGKQWDF